MAGLGHGAVWFEAARLLPAEVRLGRIVASGIEVPILLVNMV